MKSDLKAPTGHYRFGTFCLDPVNRQLRHQNNLIELNARYFDALTLLVRESGQLISKQRFLEDVWQGASVSDEALTQCIKVLRKHLGDRASQPQFIETVPKHGYRFIASVEPVDSNAGLSSRPIEKISGDTKHSPSYWQLVLNGVIGSAVAGLIGGLVLGLVASSSATSSTVATLLVVLLLTMFMAVLGGAGVVLGLATVRFFNPFGAWPIIGGALGGFLIGAFFSVLGLDAFELFMGQSPESITGALEGAILGGGVGLSFWLLQKKLKNFRFSGAIYTSLLIGCLTGTSIHFLGGQLMTGSLDAFINHFPKTQFNLDALGQMFGEKGLGPISSAISCALEAMLFTAGIVLATHREKRA